LDIGWSALHLQGLQCIQLYHARVERRALGDLLEGHAHDSDDEGWSDDQVAVFGLDDECAGQELAVGDVEGVVRVEVLVEEGAILAQVPRALVGHFWQPDVLPDCDVVRLDVFEEEADVHEEVEVARLLELVVLLRRQHEQLVLGVLSGQDVHLGVVERALDDVQLEGRQAAEAEVADLAHLVVPALDGQRGGLEVEGQVEGVVELCVVEAVDFAAAVLAVADDVLALAHQLHVQLDERLVLVQLELVQLQLLLLHHHHQHQHLLQLHELLHLVLQRLRLVR
jgi:hypothetical protein